MDEGSDTDTVAVAVAAAPTKASHAVPDSDGDGTQQRRGSAFAPFACNVCLRSYSRVDHLARHYRSHTKERPFVCETCGKQFSRADLLRRHSTSHTGGSVKKRKRASSPPKNRVSLACVTCSAAKVKCEEDKPCRRCVQGGLKCETPKTTNELRGDSPSDTQFAAGPAFTPNHGDQASSLPPQDHSTILPAPVMPDASNDIDDLINGSWFHDGAALGDFLADVMMPVDLMTGSTSNDAPERDVLDFGIDSSIDFNFFDFGTLDSYKLPAGQSLPQPPPLENPSYPPSRGDDGQGPGIDSHSSEAFQRSIWRWIPGKLDRGQCEELNLSLPSNVGVIRSHVERPVQERLTQSARDKVMAMVMATCDPSALPHVVSQFPSTDILDCLIQDFLAMHRLAAISYIHISTYESNKLRPELVAMTGACGAVRNSVLAVRKLGFALQEAVRLTLPKTWEKDNRLTRDLQLLQSYVMCLKVGLWSGNKRKMEIAESHGQPVVTMLRRSGRFRKSKSSADAPAMSDPPNVLNEKWRAWIEGESFKRLVFALVIHDAQVSMSFFIPPLVTRAEISLELPSSSKLWEAPTANAWRDAYLTDANVSSRRPPSAASCIYDPHVMLDAANQINMDFSKQIMLNMFWKQVWDSRQLNGTAQHTGSANPASNIRLASNHWQQDLAQSIQHFRMVISDSEPLSAAAALVHEHLLLNIFVSFEDLSLFAGKEGTREARRAFPMLLRWVKGRDSRQAVWHAGQIIREAISFPPGLLQDFYAIALYHAGLTLWAYGLLSNENLREQTKIVPPSNSKDERHYSFSQPKKQARDIAFLDRCESVETQRFIALDRAVPAIHRVSPDPHVGLSSEDNPEAGARDAILLDDPRAVLETVIFVLQRNHGPTNERAASLLVENLTCLMRDLSRAAMKFGSK